MFLVFCKSFMETRIGGHMIHKMFFMHYYYRGCAARPQQTSKDEAQFYVKSIS